MTGVNKGLIKDEPESIYSGLVFLIKRSCAAPLYL